MKKLDRNFKIFKEKLYLLSFSIPPVVFVCAQSKHFDFLKCLYRELMYLKPNLKRPKETVVIYSCTFFQNFW